MKKLLRRQGPNLLVIFIAFLFVWPMLWVVVAAFDLKAPLTIRLPEQFTLDHFKAVLSNETNYRSFFNSFVIAFSQSALVVALSLLASYPLSRYTLKHKNKILFSILFLTGLPITAIMVPVYLVFFKLGMSNSLISTTLFMVATSLPYSIWMMKNFMDDVPQALEEAARMDGARPLQILSHVILPVILPGTLVVFIFNFSGSWGNFFVPFILLSSVEKMPAAVSIYQFFGQYGQVVYGQLAAFSLMYTMPIAILYVLSQQFMSKGFAFAGSVK